MKVKNLLLILFVLLIGFSSCSKESSLSKSIPVDAFYIIRVDANSLIKKSEYDVFQNTLVQRGISLGRAFMKDNEVKILNSFLENANSLGVDLKGEYYIYMTGSQFGAVLKVLDAKKLKESFDIVAKNGQVEFSDGVYSITNPGSVIVWDDNKIIFSARFNPDLQDKSNATLLAEVKSQLNQSEEKSINSNPQYKTFISEAKDVSLYYVPSKIQELVSEQQDKQALEVLKEFDGVSIVSYQDFETGKVSTTGKYLYDSNDTEKRFKTFASQFSSSIKGDQLKFIPNDPLLFASVNLKGQEINKYISKIRLGDNKDIDQRVSNNTQEILHFLDGDLTFVISDIYSKKAEVSDTLSIDEKEIDDFDGIDDDYTSFNEPSNDIAINFALLADVSNVDSLSNFLQEKAANEVNKFEKISPNIYKLTKDPNNIVYFGLKGNLAFATTIESVYQSIVNDKPLEKASVVNVKNKTAYISGDISKFKTSLITDLGLSAGYYDTATVTKTLALLGLFNKFEFSVNADTYAMDGDLFLNNTKDNSLKSICLGIDQLISNLASNLF